MQLKYFVFHNARNHGPYSFAEIELMVERAELFPTDYVYLSDKGDWVPILEFIMVQGPKLRVTKPTLKTLGARSDGDHEVDYRRFASSMPASHLTSDEPKPRPSSKDAQIYPPSPEQQPSERPATSGASAGPVVPEFPPPPRPPRAVVERKLLTEQQEVRSRKRGLQTESRTKSPTQRPVTQTPLKPAVIAPRRQNPTSFQMTKLDTSAIATVDVRPGPATRLEIEVTGGGRVGEIIEVLVRAVDHAGHVDRDFATGIRLTCNCRAEGLGPLHFIAGVAQQRVRCLESGQYEFSLQATEPYQTTDSSQVLDQEDLMLCDEGYAV